MDDNSVVRAWKDPDARQETTTADHPAGEIKPASASRLSQRIGLLSGFIPVGLALTALLDTPEITTTGSPPTTIL